MAKLTDGRRTISIELREWDACNNDWFLDWSDDFFEIGRLKKAEDADDIYVVEDVEYCIEQAEDWHYARGDFWEDREDRDFDPDDRWVEVEEL